MRALTAKSMDALYYALIDDAVTNGVPVVTRGHACRELRPAAFTVEDARQALYSGQSRRLSYRFFAVETLQYLAGHGDLPWHAELLLAVNKNMRSFWNEESGTFDGAYGPRLRASMDVILAKLQADPWSRQCVASIWSPDTQVMMFGTKDLPCTMNLHFYQGGRGRFIGGKPRLCMTASMRSNDLNWGTPYDVAAFAAIQCALAGCLNWDVGEYNHCAGSLHVYEATPPTTVHPTGESFHPSVRLPDPTALKLGSQIPWQVIQGGAEAILLALAHHVLEKGESTKTFTCGAEMMEPFGAYWSHWCSLIRWDWEARMIETVG